MSELIEPPALLLPTEVAELLRVPRSKLRELTRDRRIRSVQIGPCTKRYRREAVAAFLESVETRPAQ